MSIVKREEAIFNEWRKRWPKLVSDGVVDEEAYLASQPRLLFLLKEVNDEGGGGWSLCEFLRKGARAQTWDNITRWVMGIRALPSDLRWMEDLENIDESVRTDTLHSIAVMNLKKSPGGYVTENKKFRQVAVGDREFIRHQIDLYDAHLLICCGSVVGDTLEEIYGSDVIEWQITRRGTYYSNWPGGNSLIYFSHPEARVTPSILHYSLIDAVRELRFS